MANSEGHTCFHKVSQPSELLQRVLAGHLAGEEVARVEPHVRKNHEHGSEAEAVGAVEQSEAALRAEAPPNSAALRDALVSADLIVRGPAERYP